MTSRRGGGFFVVVFLLKNKQTLLSLLTAETKVSLPGGKEKMMLRRKRMGPSGK